MKRKYLKLILLIVFLLGIFIMFYPLISQTWNARVQSEAIADYDKIFSSIEEADYTEMFKSAEDYNKKLAKLEYPLVQYKELSNYSKLLDVNKNGMIGYIKIDKIKVELPIYHSTTSSVLNEAVGHLEGSSLPIGGESTHSVLSAHRGLSSSKLFTNLNKLEVGDTFIINVLDKKLTYQVDKIVIVEPNDVSDLEIVEGEDYVTLITCTPYGINTHRLLVRGTRIENVIEKELIVTSDAYLIDKDIVALVISIPILIILVIYITIKPIKKKVYEEEV